MSDIISPVGTSVYRGPWLALMVILVLLAGVIAALSWAAVKEKTQRCDTLLWRFGIYNTKPDTYAKKCGCPNDFDFRFSCNSQYLPLL